VAPHASDFAFLAATARRGIADLRRALHRVRLDEHERGTQFVAAAEALLAAIEDGVGRREAEFDEVGDETDKESLVRAMRQITNDIRNVHSSTPWIEAAHSSRLPLGLVYFVDEMATALLKEHPDVITVPSPSYMYSTQHKPFAPELRALQCDYPEGMPIIVHYPVQEIDSLFLHLLIAHELGHSVISEHELLPLIATRAAASVDIPKKLGEAITQAVEIENMDGQEATATLQGVFVKWLTEAVCDALALAFLGPSFLLSVTTFLTPFAGPRPSPTHPPNNLRMQLLLGYADTWGWRPLLQSNATETLAWFDAIASEEMEAQGKSYYETLGSVIAELAPTIEGVVAEHLGERLFTPATYEAQAEEISAFLALEVLPAQHRDGSPIDRRAVLLGGWLHMFSQKGATPDKLPEVVGERNFQAFLAKALEMSAVLERWPKTEGVDASSA
jgi:hypothetical protein